MNKLNLKSKWWNKNTVAKTAEDLHDLDLRGLNGMNWPSKVKLS